MIFLCYLSVYNHIKPASQLVHESDYMIFKTICYVGTHRSGGRGKLLTDLRTLGVNIRVGYLCRNLEVNVRVGYLCRKLGVNVRVGYLCRKLGVNVRVGYLCRKLGVNLRVGYLCR